VEGLPDFFIGEEKKCNEQGLNYFNEIHLCYENVFFKIPNKRNHNYETKKYYHPKML